MPATPLALTEIPTFLRTALGDSNVFGAGLPEVPDVATGVEIYAGSQVEVRFGQAGIWRERPRYQVVSRAAANDRATAYTRAHACAAALAAVSVPGVIVAGGVTWYTLKVLQQPYFIGKDTQDRPLYAFNIELYRDPA